MSRRDGAIVAWHEVPGIAPPKKSRPVGYGVIGVVVRTEGGIAKQNGMIPKCIGGVSYHVHFVVTLPTRLTVAKAVQLVKAGSSAGFIRPFQTCETLLGNRAMAHSALVSRRFRLRSVLSPSASGRPSLRN